MWDALTSFLRNDVVTIWVAPIIGTIIVAMAVKLLAERYKSKSIINIINLANNRFIDAIRPFFIQEIEINMKIINNIRNAIKREYCADDDMLYTIEQLEEQIILDLSETKYLTEERKKELIHNVYHKFDNLKVEDSENREEKQTELIKSEISKLKNNSYRLITIFLLIIIMSIILLLNYFYTLDFSNLYWLIVILPVFIFLADMITDTVTQNKSKKLKKLTEEKSEIRAGT